MIKPLNNAKRQRDKQIVAAVKSGVAVLQVAKQANLCPEYIRAICRRHNVRVPWPPRRETPMRTAYRVIALLQRGRSHVDAGRDLCVSRQYIAQVAAQCRKHGVRLDGQQQKKKRPKPPPERREE